MLRPMKQDKTPRSALVCDGRETRERLRDLARALATLRGITPGEAAVVALEAFFEAGGLQVPPAPKNRSRADSGGVGA